jgi:hypothetical protein
MNIHPVGLEKANRHWLRALLVMLLAMVVTLTSCTAFPTEEDPSIKETQMELSVQQTIAAQQATEANIAGTVEVQKATLDTQAAQSAQQTRIAQQQPAGTETIDTQVIAQQTQQAGQATQAAEQTATAQAIPPTPVPQPTADFESWMKSANILLYEDMTSMPETNRYVKDTLEYMSVTYTDVGSAKGWLKTQTASPGPNGKDWDLLIIAAEVKQEGVNGEFINYINDALARGTSVIFETWTLDKLASGIAGPLLARCGLAFETNWTKVPPSRLVMYPLDPTNPILNEPNNGLTFSKTTSFWWDPNQNIDVGDWMEIARSGGDAKLILGTLATETTNHGTLSTCFGGQFILQTFSSHSLTFNAMKPLWENYIYNALKVRFQKLQDQ